MYKNTIILTENVQYHVNIMIQTIKAGLQQSKQTLQTIQTYCTEHGTRNIDQINRVMTLWQFRVKLVVDCKL